MASKQSTADFIVEQIQDAGEVRSRKMFGEYAIYCNDKVIGFICDDQLFIKPTTAGKEYLGEVTEAPPYPGAKNYYLISEDTWDDQEWMSQLARKTAKELPIPKTKK